MKTEFSEPKKMRPTTDAPTIAPDRELEVDDLGLVTTYPGGWERIGSL
jgi:hypothetical protein